MRHSPYILFIGFSLMAACSDSPGSHFPRYQEFAGSKELHAQAVNPDTLLFRYPFRVAVRDSVAVIMDLHNTEYFLHAFTYPAWKHIASFGRRGEAPEEMLSVTNFQFDTLDSLWVLDPNKMEITRWEISTSTCSAQRVEEIKLDKKLVRSLDLHTMESGFFVPDYMGDCRYRVVGMHGGMIKSEGSIPSETADKTISRPALAQAWRSFIDYNPKNGILAMATQLGEVIEIFNFHDNTHTVLYGPNGEPRFKSVNGEGIPTGIMGFSDIKVTDKHIYTVFHGIKFKDKLAAYQRGENPEDGGRYIYVFDLQGNPLQKYTLDKPIYGIDVNEETKTITATCVESDEPIMEFKL